MKMRLLSQSRARQWQRPLKNLRVSVACFLLTFLVLRNTIGAGKFGSPAQDFEEIRQRLQHVSVHGKHPNRVLAEVELEEGSRRDASVLPLEEEEERQENAALMVPKGHVESLGGFIIMEQGKAIDSGERRYGNSRVLLVTGSKSPVCENPAAECFLLKSLKTKVDYSQMHGYEVFYNDDTLRTSNSRASLLQRLMLKQPHVEWLWWVNAEVVITDMAFELPLLNYTGFNIVLVDSDEAITPQKRSIDFNTDSFLIRNSQWSLDFLHNWTSMGTAWADDVSGDQTMELRVGEVYVEKARILRGHWQRMAEKIERNKAYPDEGKLPFMTHLLGCNPCGKVGDMEMEVCLKHMVKALDFVENQVEQSYDFHQKRLSSS